MEIFVFVSLFLPMLFLAFWQRSENRRDFRDLERKLDRIEDKIRKQ